jgi:DNA-binding CsgD family transcriptional regulator
MCRAAAEEGPLDPEPRPRRRLTRRMRQTLGHLLEGLSEKEIAAGLGLSVHTVHHYMKLLYVCFGVQTRAELMARFMPPLQGQQLIELIKGGRLYTQRASWKTWERLRSGGGSIAAARLSEGRTRGGRRLRGTLRQPSPLVRYPGGRLGVREV